MKLQFKLEYVTAWGQDVRVEITVRRKRGADLIHAHQLNTQDGINWSGEVVLHEKEAQSFSYSYFIASGNEVLRREWCGVPRTFPYEQSKTFLLQDYWKEIPILSHLYSSAYSHCVARSLAQEPDITYYDRTLLFRVQAPQLVKGQQLALLGSLPQLGEWMPERAIRMGRGGTHEWCLALSATGLQFPFEYKYVVIDENTGDLIAWEGGENRISPKVENFAPEEYGMEAYAPNASRDNMLLAPNTVQVIWDRRLRMADEHWKTAGVVIPVFSLRSQHSQGAGDFSDLHMLVDWANRTGMRVIQLLPIYDTTQTSTWRDCYPYNAISIYALHPLYLDLSQLPGVYDEAFMQDYNREREELNALAQVDYERTFNMKMRYLHRLYEQEGEAVLASPACKDFMRRNEEWLISYSVFCHRRDEEGTSHFPSWHILSVYDEKEVRAYAMEKGRETGFYIYVQYLLSAQLSEVTSYARSNGVLLKGDIPIGISPTSVEAWTEPEYFNMQGSAGAPPDDFSADGQNWGFPTYNWKRMQQDGNRWWIRRFRKMAEYFDAYRIDHVLGFFRIWEIPVSARSGLLGHFEPCLPMSIEEIEQAGLEWREKFFTTPYITDRFLRSLLKDQADVEELRSAFLEAQGPDWYSLREEFATERQIYGHFGNVDGNPRAQAIRDALCKIVQNVLFLPLEGGFVPRISAQKTYIYESLSASEREAFNRIYEDFYYYRHNDFWGAEAMKKLPALVEATQMLCCAEDLGMVPACVAPVMSRLRILSLEIQAMPKDFGVRFGRLENNPYMSVVTIFTHDMPTLRLWWQEDEERRQQYFNEMLQKDGRAPEVMPGWLCEEVVARHLFSPSMLCLISLQDWLSMDEELRSDNIEQERINVPANPHHYWRYRMHLTIEQLMQADAFNDKIRMMIERGGRA
ncbi:MAG: 4-alpha-glucanotransferase [Bacteroidaceae bacterium]|nr:4-alpha-glucanotransferase [Bacteroidaceae bacterium]